MHCETGGKQKPCLKHSESSAHELHALLFTAPVPEVDNGNAGGVGSSKSWDASCPKIFLADEKAVLLPYSVAATVILSRQTYQAVFLMLSTDTAVMKSQGYATGPGQLLATQALKPKPSSLRRISPCVCNNGGDIREEGGTPRQVYFTWPRALAF